MRLNKWIAVMVISALFFASISFIPSTIVSAKDGDKVGSYDEKDEVIYGNLTANGTIKEMYVVNTFHMTKQGKMIDYGLYKNVRNLTNLLPIEQLGDQKIQFHADADEFYYQGELQQRELPWDIEITYLLNGEEISPEQLAGQNGELEIHINTSANKTIDATFFEYYLLQISVTLDPEIFQQVHSPKGTEAKEGKNRLISFNVMPGEEEHLVVSADVESFKMDPIQISAVPANVAIDDPEFGSMKDDMQKLTDAIRDINQGIGDLSEGTAELYSGTSELKVGSGKYLSGIQELDQSSGDLVKGSQQIQGAFGQINEAIDADIELPSMGELQQLPEQLRQMANQSEDDQVGQGLQLIADNIEQSFQQLDQLGELTELLAGLKELSSQYDEFHDGLVGYTNGVHQLSQSYQDIDQGIQGVKEGAGELNKGSKKLHDGSKELHHETRDLPNKMQSEIDEQLASFDYSDFEPLSFVSDNNKQIGVVQFVLQTERIEKPEGKEEIDETLKEKNFWQRFLDLFRKNK